MSAITIPGIGEPAIGTMRHVVSFGAATTSPDVILGTSTGEFPVFEVEEGVFVTNIEMQVVEAFDGATALDLSIGDTDNAAGWWTDTLANVIGSSAAVYNSPSSAVTYAGGKRYNAHEEIDISFVAGTVTAGKANLRISYNRETDTDLAPSTGI
jgi:hypothetical protein